jgi:hypothetical protein
MPSPLPLLSLSTFQTDFYLLGSWAVGQACHDLVGAHAVIFPQFTTRASSGERDHFTRQQFWAGRGWTSLGATCAAPVRLNKRIKEYRLGSFGSYGSKGWTNRRLQGSGNRVDGKVSPSTRMPQCYAHGQSIGFETATRCGAERPGSVVEVKKGPPM